MKYIIFIAIVIQMKYEINKSDWNKLVSKIKDIQNKNESEKYYIELKNKDRSYEQLKLYWGAWLPAILYFLKDDIKLNTVEELHIYLKEYYCYSQNKTEYFKQVEIMGHKRYICLFSINFDKCKQEIFNDYMDFVLNNFYYLITVDISDIDNLILEYNKNVEVK